MKTGKSSLIICALILAGVAPGFPAEDNTASSGVIVIGPTMKNTSGNQSGEASSNEQLIRMGASGLAAGSVTTKDGVAEEQTPVPVITGTPSNSSSRLIYEISGSRVGNTQVSQAVSLPSEGIVMFVDAGISRSFVVVRVEEDGKETLVLNTDPDRSVGARLSKGIYKVYPQDPDGAFTRDKLTARVQVGLVESKLGEIQ